MKKRKTKKVRIANVSSDTMARGIAAFLSTKGWDAFVVGPCEVRIPIAFNGGERLGDPTGKTLGQYEFIAKFYGKRQVVPCAES